MRFSLGNWAEARDPLHHGGKLAEQPLNVFPALHPVAEHLGQGSGLCRCSTGWGDPCREGISTSSTTMMACSSSRGVGGSRRKGPRVRASSPSVNANVWLVPSAAVSATWLQVCPGSAKWCRDALWSSDVLPALDAPWIHPHRAD